MIFAVAVAGAVDFVAECGRDVQLLLTPTGDGDTLLELNELRLEPDVTRPSIAEDAATSNGGA